MELLAWEYQSIDVEDVISEGRDTLDTWIPDDPYDVAISLTIHIGPANSTARDLFETAIFTNKQYREKKQIRGQSFVQRADRNKYIVVDKFEWPEIKQRLDAKIQACQRDTWPDSVMELRKHFPWEYDD